MHSLAENGVWMLRPEDLSAGEQKGLKEYFEREVLPLLSPQIVDSRHPFPHMPNKRLHIAVTLEKKKGVIFGLIAVPNELERLVRVEGPGFRFVLLEDLIFHFAELAFDIYNVLEKNVIAVTRNADIDTEEDMLDEDIDYLMRMNELIKKRQRLSPVRLETTRLPSREMLEFFCEKLRLGVPHVFHSTAPLDLSFAFRLGEFLEKDVLAPLIWPAHIPADTVPPEKKKNMIKAVTARDMLFAYPFDSISPFLALIRQAAEDASVLSVKITLYRIDTQSKLLESLIRAAENGKEVVALMELRARFDEKNNIEWAKRLEEAGCRVIYGLVGFKAHSKICLVTRKEHGKIQYITQIGTGNYNEKTSRQYTDLSLITADQAIGGDAVEFFANMLLGNLEGEYKQLWVAPNGFKSNILKHIREERRKALAGQGGRILIKCNSLTDKEIIEALSEASQDGVKIDMIIRGICCLVPRLPGESENIRVVSIVGKFLEHSRVYCFGDGASRRIYISSADLMTRNTQRRVEIACPIHDPALKERLLRMLETMLADNTQAQEQFADGRYLPRERMEGEPPVNSQEVFTSEAREAAKQLEAQNYGDAEKSPPWLIKLFTRWVKK